MRHRIHGRKLGRDSEHRRAMLRNLAAGLFEHGQIETTLAKAKAVQPFVEKLITVARAGTLAASEPSSPCEATSTSPSRPLMGNRTTVPSWLISCAVDAVQTNVTECPASSSLVPTREP